MEKKKNQNKQILILGGGFAGVRAALSLSDLEPKANIIVISNNPYHLYYPTLYEVATAPKDKAGKFLLKKTVAVSLSDIFKKRKNITVKIADIEQIDLDKGLVHTSGGDLFYNALIVAMGADVNYYNIEGLEEHALTLKSFDDALNIRNRIYELFEKGHGRCNIVIGGGGFTGVEFTAELINYLHYLAKHRHIREMLNLTLIEGSDQLLPGQPLKVSKLIHQRLISRGVHIKLNSFITKAKKDSVVIGDSEEVKGDLIVWTGGVKAADVPFNKRIPKDKQDRIIVTSRMNLDAYPEIFVVGDCSAWIDPANKKPLAQTAQVAQHQARFAAKAVSSQLSGRQVPIYRPKRNFPMLIPVGGKYAILVTHNKSFSGLFPYILRRLADLRYLLSIMPLIPSCRFWMKGTVVYMHND